MLAASIPTTRRMIAPLDLTGRNAGLRMERDGGEDERRLRMGANLGLRGLDVASSRADQLPRFPGVLSPTQAAGSLGAVDGGAAVGIGAVAILIYAAGLAVPVALGYFWGKSRCGR